MSSEEAVRADAMETVVEVRARRAREGWEDARGDRRRSLARERGGIGRRAFERGRRARWDRWWGGGDDERARVRDWG